MKYELKETQEFDKQFTKLPNEIRCRFEAQFKQVQMDPYSIGKALSFRWLRELKNEGYRVYYLVYDNEVVVLFVGESDKKNQSTKINAIKSNINQYKRGIKNGKDYKSTKQ